MIKSLFILGSIVMGTYVSIYAMMFGGVLGLIVGGISFMSIKLICKCISEGA